MPDTLKALVEAYLLHVVTQQCELGACVMIGPANERLAPRDMLSSSSIHAICRHALEGLERVVRCASDFDVSVDVRPSGHVALTVTRKD